MKLILFSILLLASPVLTEQMHYPENGTDMLDACSIVVASMDNPSNVTSLDGKQFNTAVQKSNWCVGYLQALMYVNAKQHIQLAIMKQLDVTLAGDEKSKQTVFELLRGACIPDGVSVAQLARVVTKFLCDHPEKLHQPSGPLAEVAFMQAFPCSSQPSP
jgi:hypothetical protein